MEANFLSAAGFTVGALQTFFQVIFASLLTIWFAWVIRNQYYIYASGKLDLGGFSANATRALAVWLALMFFIAI